jgi:hypothetical protein
MNSAVTAPPLSSPNRASQPPEACVNPLGHGCVGKDRLVATIVQSGVVDGNLEAALGKMSEKELNLVAQMVSRIKHNEQNGTNLASGMSAAQAKEFLRSLITEATKPDEINQGMHTGCTVVTMMSRLARENPAEYLRIGVELASKGTAKLKNGEDLLINRSAFEASLTDKTGRYSNLTMSERVMMASLMDFGNGKGATYDFRTDQSSGFRVGGEEIGLHKGLYQHQYLRVASALFGDIHHTESDTAKVRAHLEGKNAPGTLVDIRWSKTGDHVNHMVEFIGFDKNGDVIIRNPWGTENPPTANGPASRRVRPDLGKGYETISREEFYSRINSIVVVDNSKPPMTAENDPSVRGDLGKDMPYAMGVVDPAVWSLTNGTKSAINQLNVNELSRLLDEHGDSVAQSIEGEVIRREKKKAGPQVNAEDEEGLQRLRAKLGALGFPQNLPPNHPTP